MTVSLLCLSEEIRQGDFHLLSAVRWGYWDTIGFHVWCSCWGTMHLHDATAGARCSIVVGCFWHGMVRTAARAGRENLVHVSFAGQMGSLEITAALNMELGDQVRNFFQTQTHSDTVTHIFHISISYFLISYFIFHLGGRHVKFGEGTQQMQSINQSINQSIIQTQQAQKLQQIPLTITSYK